MADLSGKADPFSEGVEDMAVLMLSLLSNWTSTRYLFNNPAF
jgi:hypothetical protein